MNRIIFFIAVLTASTLAFAQRPAATEQNRVLRIGVHSDVRFILVDPDGRSAGFDRKTGLATTQIPNSTPSEDCSTITPSKTSLPCFRQIEIRNPALGLYRMEIVEPQAGAYGLYWSDEAGSHKSGRAYSNIRAITNELQIYNFVLAQNPSGDWFRGNFTGEQAAGDADDFLTYGRPSSDPLDLPAGTNSYAIVVAYGPTVDPRSFRATLNNSSVANLFHPAPKRIETVRIPLRSGRNVLKLEISGTLENRTVPDVDTLVFNVK